MIVVHHAKKRGGKIRAGQALRGSSEFHAWGDSNLCRRRSDQDLTLTIEDRAAPSFVPIMLELRERDTHLRAAGTVVPPPTVPRPLDERIKEALADAGGQLPIADLRARCRVRNATPRERLLALTRAGLLLRDAQGYRLAVTRA